MSSIEVVPGPQSQDGPVLANLYRLTEVVAAEKADWQAAIDAGDGSEPHHAAEIAALDEYHGRIGYLVSSMFYGVTEPIDREFVLELVDYLKATDAFRDVWQEPILREHERSAIEAAVASLRQRNARLPEAA